MLIDEKEGDLRKDGLTVLRMIMKGKGVNNGVTTDKGRRKKTLLTEFGKG